MVLQMFLLSTIDSHGTKHKQVTHAELHQLYYGVCSIARKLYNGCLICILQSVKTTRPISWATFLCGEPWKSSPMGFYGKTLQLSLAKHLFALIRRNSPERHHLYWLNTMKPINLPPSMSTGHTTIVLILPCNLWEKISQDFFGH